MFRLCFMRAGYTGRHYLVGTLQELRAFAAQPGVTVLADPYNPPGFAV